MSKTQGFDAFLNEGAELRAAAEQQLTEQTELSEAKKMSMNDAMVEFEDTLAELGLKKGKKTGEGNLGGGVKTFSYNVKMSDKDAAKAAKILQPMGIFISNMEILSEVLVSFKG